MQHVLVHLRKVMKQPYDVILAVKIFFMFNLAAFLEVYFEPDWTVPPRFL